MNESQTTSFSQPKYFVGIVCIGLILWTVFFTIPKEFMTETFIDRTLPVEKLIPTALQEAPTCDINDNLSDFLISTKLGWMNKSAPKWLQTMCPEVVAHFNRFPAFNQNLEFNHTSISTQTTDYAAQAVCTMKVVNTFAASNNSRVYLHAGSHLGAVIHGQPIPWDDDVDMIMDFDKKAAFLDTCEANKDIHSGVQIHCLEVNNAVKVWLQPEGMIKHTKRRYKHWSPFVDLFFFKIAKDHIHEVTLRGKLKNLSFRLVDYFPTQVYYFAGIHLIGPLPQISQNRYKVQNCVMGSYVHRMETQGIPATCIDCMKLAQVFPFIYHHDYITTGTGDVEQKIFPVTASTISPLTVTTIGG